MTTLSSGSGQVEERILLDTHVLLWSRSGDQRLGSDARSEIERAWWQGELAVSAMSFWEVAMLQDKGRFTLRREVGAWRTTLLEEGLIEIPVNGAIAAAAGSLPDMHGDPAGRVIAATALDGHLLVTADRRLLDWPGDLDTLDARQ